jgi:hypothetical protein
MKEEIITKTEEVLKGKASPLKEATGEETLLVEEILMSRTPVSTARRSVTTVTTVLT